MEGREWHKSKPTEHLCLFFVCCIVVGSVFTLCSNKFQSFLSLSLVFPHLVTYAYLSLCHYVISFPKSAHTYCVTFLSQVYRFFMKTIKKKNLTQTKLYLFYIHSI